MACSSPDVEIDGNDAVEHRSTRSIDISSCSNSGRSYQDEFITGNRSYIDSPAYMKQSERSATNNSHYSTMSETLSDIVPPLDIRSEENFPTTRDYTFSYRKHSGVPKHIPGPDVAYQNWLSAKRKIISDENARRRKVEEQKEKEQEARKQLSKEKVEQWHKSKIAQQSRKVESQPHIVEPKAEKPEKPKPKPKPKPNDRQCKVNVKLETWERNKQRLEDNRRAQKRIEEQQRRDIEEQRRAMSAVAWEKWIAVADKKPKPVPLNQGFFTLRGTISDIFVNPQEWQSILPIKEE